MKKWSFVLVLSCFLILLTGCSDQEPQSSVDSPKPTATAKIIKEPFSASAGWFNEDGISVFYKPTNADQPKESGLIDQDGQKVMDEKAQELFPAGKSNLFTFQKDDLFGLMDQDGKIILDPISTSSIVFEDGVGCYEKDKKFGIVKEDMSLTPTLSDVEIGFGKEDAAVFLQNSKYGIIRRDGEVIAEPIYDWIDLPRDHKFLCRKGDETAWIGYDGKVDPISTKKIQIVDAPSPKSGLGVYKKDGRYGLTEGTDLSVLTEPISDEFIYLNQNGYGTFSDRNKFGMLYKGNIIKKPFSEVPLLFDKENIALYFQDGAYGFIDGQGEKIKVPKHDKIEMLTDTGIAVFYQNHKAGILKDDGTIWVKPFCDEIKLQPGSDRIWYRDRELWGIAKLPHAI